jgi:hypothetical protein
VERRDYLLRMIEEMGRITARIREMLLGGETVKAAAELQTAARVVGLDVATARALTADSLLLLLRMSPDSDPGRVKLAADLLDLDADIAEAEGKVAAAEKYRDKAAQLRNNLPAGPVV